MVLPAYERAARCPVLRYCCGMRWPVSRLLCLDLGLRTRYAVSGTEIAYGGTRPYNASSSACSSRLT
eukprot:2858453-Rhodomonas_salina.1